MSECKISTGSTDCISRQSVIDLMMQKWGENFSGDDAMQESIDAIRELPSVTPQEPKTGKWISTETKGVRCAFWCRYKCSLCGELSDHTNFCPNCGAKMESEDKG